MSSVVLRPGRRREVYRSERMSSRVGEERFVSGSYAKR